MTLAFIAALSACNKTSNETPADGATSVTENTCDPLGRTPITLGAIVGVAQDTAGTLYVDSANGIFVSANGELIRQVVLSSAPSGTNELTFQFESPGEPASDRDLIVDTQGSTASAMALSPAFVRYDGGAPTPLTIVDPSTVSGLTVVNYASNVIAFVGDVANGDVLLATVPLNDDAASGDGGMDGGVEDGGLAIFYGPQGAVAQRTITAFENSPNGDSTTYTVTFLVGDAPYVLVFGTDVKPDASSLAYTVAGLTLHLGDQIAVTLRSPTPTADPPRLSFTCLP
jgi:hypothetical protein